MLLVLLEVGEAGGRGRGRGGRFAVRRGAGVGARDGGEIGRAAVLMGQRGGEGRAR